MKRILFTFSYQRAELHGALYKCLHLSRCQSTITFDSPVSFDALSKAKSFEDMPGPKPLPLIGNMHRYLPLIGEYSMEWHEASLMKYQQYGSIVRETFTPGFTMVHLYDSHDIETVNRNEGLYPKREFFVGMKVLREQKPHLYSNVGIASGNGESWHYLRSRSQKVLMRPQIMKQFIPQMNVIADDLVGRIRRQRNDQMQVPGLLDEFFKWALESISFVLFKRRLGCLSDNLTEDSQAMKYIRAINDFFTSSAKVEMAMLPIWRRYPKLSPALRKLDKAHTFFFENALEYVKEAIEKLEEPSSDDNDLSLMELLLRYCSPQDASVMAIDSMAAGVDTTSLSMSYVLRHLAANPEAQRRLQADIDRVLPNKTSLTVETLEELPYLRACIKESMRLTPVVQGTTRILDKDIILSGYRVPANTVLNINYFVTSIQESNFPEAHKYKPERWLRDDSSDNQGKESFAFQPFGFGPRMCIGRRIAELEMFSLLTKIMQNFWVENKHHDLKLKFQLVLMIKNPLLYEFHERDASK